MNILQQEDLVKGLPDQALMQQAQMPTGELPQFLVVSEIQRREKMRKSFAEAVPEESIKDQVISSGIAAMNPTPDPLMANAMGVQGGQDPMMGQTQDPMMQQQVMAADGGMMPYRMDEGRGVPNITPRDHIGSSFQLLEMGQISNVEAISEAIRQLKKAKSSEELEDLRSFIEYKAATSEGMPEDLANTLYNYSYSPAKSLIDEISRRREENTAAGLPSASIDSNAIREDIAKNNEVDLPLAQYILAEESGSSKINRKVQERQESDIAESQGRSRSGIMSLNPQITDADRIYAGDTLNLSGGGITPYKMNAGRKTYSAKELQAIENLIVKGYSKEEAENIVRFTPTGETQKEIAESIYDYQPPIETGRRGNRRIPGGETRESLMKRIFGDNVPEFMMGFSSYPSIAGKNKFMDLAAKEGFLDKLSSNNGATVADVVSEEKVEEIIPDNIVVGAKSEDFFLPGYGNRDVKPPYRRESDSGAKGNQVNPTDFLSKLDTFRNTYGNNPNTNSILKSVNYLDNSLTTNFEGLLDAERTRSLEASKEMKADAMNNALVQLGAGIAKGDLSGGLSKAGTVAMQGRKEARAEEKGLTGLERQMKLLGAQEKSSLARKQLESEAEIERFNLQTAISQDKNTLEAFKALEALGIQREAADTAAEKQALDDKIGAARIKLYEAQAEWYASGGSAKNPIVEAQTYYNKLGTQRRLELKNKYGNEEAAIQAIVAMMASGEIDPIAMSGGPTALPTTGSGGHSILRVRND